MKSKPTLVATFSALMLSAPAFAHPMTAVLRLKDKVPLEQLAQNVRTAHAMGIATSYTPAEIREISGPSQADYDALIAQLGEEGFEITSESPTHLWISIKADSAVFENVFGTRVESVRPGVHRPMMAPVVPASLSLVAAITGFDNTHKRHPLYTRMGKKPMDAPGGILPNAIKAAYGFDAIYQAGISGQGQSISIATYDGFNADDVNQFYSYYKLSPAPTVDAVNFNGTATYSEDSAMETQLDAEFSGMMAPGASIHVFTSADNSDAGELAMFTAIMDDNRSKVVNYSWGSCETTLDSSHAQEMDKVFARALAQGVNITVASGDSGSDACQDGSTAADWPAAHPDVIAVGGTTLTLDSSNHITTEAAWNGSGGGISTLWALPTWQQQLGGQFVKRSFPDVAFNADPNSGQAIYAHNSGTAGWLTIGGTSMAAPQWAGFLTLVNSARQAQGRAPLAFLNPIIYGMSPADRAATFHDVTSGSNGTYTAGPGWDAVTGWGSMQAQALLTYLVNQ